jgi:hypothetical protein
MLPGGSEPERRQLVVEAMRSRAASATVTLLAVALACGAGNAQGVASRCGDEPTFQPTLGVPTPHVASAPPTATLEKMVVIGVWSDCVRPQMATVLVGQLVQWQAKEEIAPEIVLEDGTSLGHVRHVLELTFPRPGSYRYHFRDLPAVSGTLVVGAP